MLCGAIPSWGAVWAKPNVDGMLGIVRLALACGLYNRHIEMRVKTEIEIHSDSVEHSPFNLGAPDTCISYWSAFVHLIYKDGVLHELFKKLAPLLVSQNIDHIDRSSYLYCLRIFSTRRLQLGGR